MRRPFASSLLAVSGALALAACYDWAIGVGPRDGGSRADVEHVDGALPKSDAGAERDATGDATGPSDAGKATDTSTPPEASVPPCTTLASKVSATEALAQSCTLGVAAECTTAVRDACGCNRYVAMAAAAATSDYASAVATFLDAGCVAACAGCLEPGAVTGTCLEMGTGSGVTTACSP